MTVGCVHEDAWREERHTRNDRGKWGARGLRDRREVVPFAVELRGGDPLVALLGFIARVPLVLFASVVRHRGATHWLSTGVAVTVICGVIAGAVDGVLVLPVAAGLGAGYTLHLLADACTPHGVPLLGPFSTRKRHVLPTGRRIPTGSGRETVVCLAAMCGAGLLVASTWA